MHNENRFIDTFRGHNIWPILLRTPKAQESQWIREHPHPRKTLKASTPPPPTPMTLQAFLERALVSSFNTKNW